MKILTSILFCAATLIINQSKESWNNHDQKTLDSAKITCKVRYDSCLKKFIKKNPREYVAICGEE